MYIVYDLVCTGLHTGFGDWGSTNLRGRCSIEALLYILRGGGGSYA